jgi:hypothetical protein
MPSRVWWTGRFRADEVLSNGFYLHFYDKNSCGFGRHRML